MSALDDSLARWWQHERPEIERRNRAEVDAPSLADPRVAQLFDRGLREAFGAGWRARQKGGPGDLDGEIHRWWNHDKPTVERQIRRAYSSTTIDDDRILRFIFRGLRAAFSGGWDAAARQQGATGAQSDLFGAPGKDPPK